MKKSKLLPITLITTIMISLLNTGLFSNSINKMNLSSAQQSETSLKDKNGRLVGKIKIKSDGTQEIRDKNGRYLGKYNPKNNTTYNKNGSKVGTGNQLASLLIN